MLQSRQCPQFCALAHSDSIFTLMKALNLPIFMFELLKVSANFGLIQSRSLSTEVFAPMIFVK
jgi:hypothetical protein